jgi:lipopolysaccharide export system protein LptA
MRFLFTLLTALLLAFPALAASPIKVTADTFTIDDANSEATFSGNVVIVRTGLSVNADKVVVDYGSGGMEDIKSFVATGHVRLQTKDQDATGEKAVFDPATQLLRMTGNVQVVNANGTLNGPELILNLADNTTIFNGGKGGRVTGVFTPQ